VLEGALATSVSKLKPQGSGRKHSKIIARLIEQQRPLFGGEISVTVFKDRRPATDSSHSSRQRSNR